MLLLCSRCCTNRAAAGWFAGGTRFLALVFPVVFVLFALLVGFLVIFVFFVFVRGRVALSFLPRRDDFVWGLQLGQLRGMAPVGYRAPGHNRPRCWDRQPHNSGPGTARAPALVL